MKIYKQVLRLIQINSNSIKKLEETVTNSPTYYSEITHAKLSGDAERVEELEAKQEEQNKKDRKTCEKIEALQLENAFLRDNLEVSIIAEALPLIKKAFEPYEGKQYGEKTRDKIHEELRREGFSVWLDGFMNRDTINITPLNDQGFTNGMMTVKLHSHYEAPYITSDNKIQLQGAEFRNATPYHENIKEAVRALKKAYKKHEEATAKALETRNALNALLPHNRRKSASNVERLGRLSDF